MKTLYLILIICSLTLAKAAAQDAVGANSQEKKVLKLINSLPEIISSNQQRPKERQVSAYVESTPTPTHKYYAVFVCDSSANRLFTYYRFRVYLPNYTIYYDDFDTGKLVSLKKWQKHPYGIYSKL
ncbi:hypothetical protein [Mucilaginibacter sp. NFX135]|uniref:hypothetical protein n=1 Tax=Mucilaginibacter sp. NFX135 TaxID=3402687 RepID=UPI003AFA452A